MRSLRNLIVFVSLSVPGHLAAAPLPPAPQQAALARELAPKVNRFQEVWDRCPDARLRGPATAAFRRWIAESIELAGDKNARRRWIRSLPLLDARYFGADAGGALVAVVPKTCALLPSAWPTSVTVGASAEPDDLLAQSTADAEESSATVRGAAVPAVVYATFDAPALLALTREGRLSKPVVVYDAPEKAAPLKSGGFLVTLAVAPGAAAGPGREFQQEGAAWRWVSPTAFAGASAVPEKYLSMSDLVAAAGTVKESLSWKALVDVAVASGMLRCEWRRLVETATAGLLPENARRALLALTRDGAKLADLPPAEATNVIDAMVGADETTDRRIVARLMPSWITVDPTVAAWMERIAKAHPDAILDGWSPAILEDDSRLAAAWVGAGPARKAIVERAAERDLPEGALRRIAEVARLDREPSVRAATAAIDYAMCVRQSAAGMAARCGLYGAMLGLLSDPDARVRYSALEQVRYRVQVRGHRFTAPTEWQALLEPLPKGPAEASAILPLLKAGADEDAFARWVRTVEGRKWVAAVTISTATGIEDVRRWALDNLGSMSSGATQARAGIPQATPVTPLEFSALAAKVQSTTAVEPVRQPAQVAPTVSTIDRVVDSSGDPEAVEATRGADESPETPLMPPGK